MRKKDLAIIIFWKWNAFCEETQKKSNMKFKLSMYEIIEDFDVILLKNTFGYEDLEKIFLQRDSTYKVNNIIHVPGEIPEGDNMPLAEWLHYQTNYNGWYETRKKGCNMPEEIMLSNKVYNKLFLKKDKLTTTNRYFKK